jgi:hypothetical protein
MPKVANLPNTTSTLAFTVPASAKGFILWNESTATVRVRVGNRCGVGDADLGRPIPPGNTTPQFYEHRFSFGNDVGPSQKSVRVYLYQASGGALNSGVGYDLLLD